MKKITALTGRLTEVVCRAERQRDLRAWVASTTSSSDDSASSMAALGNATWDAVGRAGVLARRAGLGFATVGYAFKRTFVDTAPQFEDFRTTLETIEGASEEAKASMDWIDAFAVKTPFELEQVSAHKRSSAGRRMLPPVKPPSS